MNKLLYVFLIISLFGCKKAVVYGEKPKKLDKDINYRTGVIYFKNERLDVRYLEVQDYIRKDSSSDIIFYLHGFNRTELEWVEENGFGKIFYNVIKENPKLKSFTVVSISIGGTYLFIDHAPSPYYLDMETFFFNKLVPYFKNKLAKNGKIYLIGHDFSWNWNWILLGNSASVITSWLSGI